MIQAQLGVEMPHVFALNYDANNEKFETPTSWRLYFYDYPPIYIPKKLCTLDEKAKVAYLPGWLVDRKNLRGRAIRCPGVRLPGGKKAKTKRIYTDADEPPV